MRCKHCNSCDIWRVPQQNGLRAYVARLRDMKPFKCRACGFLFYHRRNWIAPAHSSKHTLAA